MCPEEQLNAVMAASALMRPALALYIGGLGARQQNFYNTLVQQYGIAREAAEIQDLYLSGKREEAFREAGVGTLIASPIASPKEGQVAQLRALAELAV